MARDSASKKLNFFSLSRDCWTSVRGDRIAGGAAGDIYSIVDDEANLVKVFRSLSDRSRYEKKIEEMLTHAPTLSPISQGGYTHHQLSWPNAICRDSNGDFLGYRMPRVHLEKSENLERLMQTKMRRIAGLPEFYGYRVTCAANLAGVINAVHKAGHCIIDLKPANIQFYKDNMYVSLLDCDGFRILGNGQNVFPAYQYTKEYIAPEATQLRPEDLSFEQDNFALAVIIFRLLNNGIHPFQASMKRKQLTIQAMVERKSYAYGYKGTNNLIPSKMSIHGSFPSEIRENFDRAFKSSKRPTAKEWFETLRDFGDPKSGKLVRCDQNQEHAHFGIGCGLCKVENGKPWPANVTGRSGKLIKGQLNSQAWVQSKTKSGITNATASPALGSSSKTPIHQRISSLGLFRMGTIPLNSDPDIYDLDKVTLDTRLDTVRPDKIFLKPGTPRRLLRDWDTWRFRRHWVTVWTLRLLDAVWLALLILGS
jgi:DNA-binding helix-hairpin-helix protein with protein kinase domain